MKLNIYVNFTIKLRKNLVCLATPDIVYHIPMGCMHPSIGTIEPESTTVLLCTHFYVPFQEQK